MRKMRARNLMLVMAMVFIFGVGTSYASSIYITGPTVVNKFTDPTFEFSVYISDIGALGNLDEFNLGLALDPESNATFVSALDVSGYLSYVFYGDSFDYNSTVLNPYQIVVGDLTAEGDGSHTSVADLLLATITVDVSSAEVCEWYSIVLFDGGWSYFGNVIGNYEDFPADLQLAEYEFHVVPIPGTVLLLGSGMLGLLGIRRRMRG